MNLHFKKMHGLGNDFVIIDGRVSTVTLSPALIIKMADRRFGVGCDQLIILEPSSRADVFMRIYNPDGSEAGACGNATRCVADIIGREKNQQQVSIETISGVLECIVHSEFVTVNMNVPKFIQHDVVIQNFTGSVIDMGNPHFVTIVKDIKLIDVSSTGKSLEEDPYFPNRSNIEFVEVLSKQHVRMHVWERGAGVTLACGSGACAVAVALIAQNIVSSPVKISMDGGDLEISYNHNDDRIVNMKGAVTYVFEGDFNSNFLIV